MGPWDMASVSSTFDITFQLFSHYHYKASVQVGGLPTALLGGGDAYANLTQVGAGSIFEGGGDFSGTLDPGTYRLVAFVSGYWYADKYDGGGFYGLYDVRFSLPDYVSVPDSIAMLPCTAIMAGALCMLRLAVRRIAR
jgi:hypothetical protein